MLLQSEFKASYLTYKLCHFAPPALKGGRGKMAELRLKKNWWFAQEGACSVRDLAKKGLIGLEGSDEPGRLLARIEG